MNTTTIIKRPCKVNEIDESFTKSIIKSTVFSHNVEDENTGKPYKIIRTKTGLTMIGA